MQVKFILFLNCFLWTSVLFGQEKIDTSNAKTNILPAQVSLSNSNVDSMVISIHQLDELINSVKQNNSGWKDILSLIIALIAVIISAWSVYNSRKQINAQIRNAEEQLRSQEAQSQEQLRLAREQIQETSKMTLDQVRANNVSQARINWVQDLRTVLSELIGEVAVMTFYLDSKFVLTKDEEDPRVYRNKLLGHIKKAQELSFKVKLFLSSKEDNHKILDKLLDNFLSSLTTEKPSAEFTNLSMEILITSRLVLKEAWEQAKNEGTKR